MNAHKTRKVSIEAHPAGLVILSVAGTLIAIRVLMHAPPQDLSASLWIGLGVWLPVLLFEKWFLRRFRDTYVEYYTSPKTTILWFQFPQTILIIWATIWLEVTNRLTSSGVPIIFALAILIYPEQKAIYEAAKAKLEEDRMQMDADA